MNWQSRLHPISSRRWSATTALVGIAAFLALTAGILLSGLAAAPTEATDSASSGSTVDFTHTKQPGNSDGHDAVITHDPKGEISRQQVDTTAPTVSSVSITSTPASVSTYGVGDVITVRATFSENIKVTGKPRLTLAIGNKNRPARYSATSGSAVDFTYKVKSNDKDTDGIAIAADSIALNSGTIQDAASNDATLSHSALAAQSAHKVNGTIPNLTDIGWFQYPANGETFIAGENIFISAAFSEDITVTGDPQITLTIGNNTRTATEYVTTQDAIIFAYTVQAGETDTDGISADANSLSLNGGSIQDSDGNDALIAHPAITKPATFYVEAIVPTISSVAITSTPATVSTYGAYDVITVRATFSENVKVTKKPRLTLAIGNKNRPARYSATSGSAVDFTYKVKSNDSDTDGIAIAADSIVLNGGTIQDTAGNNATLSHTALAAQSAQKVDGDAPIIWEISLWSRPSNGHTYKAGESIIFGASFNEELTVTGDPQVTLNIGNNTRTVNASLTTAQFMLFGYTVQAGESDTDGISADANVLSLNGGTIRDSDGNDALLAHPALAANAYNKVDGIAPTVSSVSLTSMPASNTTYTSGETITARATFNDNVTVTGKPTITLSVGSNSRTAAYSASSGSTVDLHLHGAE